MEDACIVMAMGTLIGILQRVCFYHGFYIWRMDFRYCTGIFSIRNFVEVVFQLQVLLFPEIRFEHWQIQYEPSEFFLSLRT